MSIFWQKASSCFVLRAWCGGQRVEPEMRTRPCDTQAFQADTVVEQDRPLAAALLVVHVLVEIYM